jgi:hypothetical protein
MTRGPGGRVLTRSAEVRAGSEAGATMSLVAGPRPHRCFTHVEGLTALRAPARCAMDQRPAPPPPQLLSAWSRSRWARSLRRPEASFMRIRSSTEHTRVSSPSPRS